MLWYKFENLPSWTFYSWINVIITKNNEFKTNYMYNVGVFWRQYSVKKLLDFLLLNVTKQCSQLQKEYWGKGLFVLTRRGKYVPQKNAENICSSIPATMLYIERNIQLSGCFSHLAFENQQRKQQTNQVSILTKDCKNRTVSLLRLSELFFHLYL